jgi:hypothetical protein
MTGSDHSDHSDDANNRVADGVERLTDEKGPLVQLVNEVKRSNRLATLNQRWLRWVLIALIVCLVGLTSVVLKLSR